MSKFMFTDRLFLPVPYYTKDCPFNLLQRLIVANRIKERPFDLTRIADSRSVDNAALGIGENYKVFQDFAGNYAWSFYLPSAECPLTYREVAVWCRLYQMIPSKGTAFTQSQSALAKDLLGLDRDTIHDCADKLQEHDLIKWQTPVNVHGKTYWLIKPIPERCREWFEPIEADDTLAAFEQEAAALWKPTAIEKEPQSAIIWEHQTEVQPSEPKEEPKPADYEFIMSNEQIPIATRRGGYQYAKHWWNTHPNVH